MISDMTKKFALKLFLAAFIALICMPISLTRSEAQGMDSGIPKVWSIESHYTWIGNTSHSLAALSVNVNGKPVESGKLIIENYDGTIHIRLQLVYGASNLISIKNGSDILFQADVFYSPSYEEQLVPEEYQIAPFHSIRNEEQCLSCHRLEVTDKDKISAVNTEHICYSCHNRKFTDRSSQHYAAGLHWQCLRCHQSEAMETDYSMDGPIKFVIKEGMAVAPLCFQCHINREKEFAEYEYVHGPIGMQLCIMCHNPHGSNTRKLLQKDISTLCIECHNLQDMLKQPTIHGPVSIDDCTSCHDPHGSNFRYLLENDVNEVCLSCHTEFIKKSTNHPIRNHPVSGPEDPADTTRKFTCVSCHNPHSSRFRVLLPDEDIMQTCVRCHPQ